MTDASLLNKIQGMMGHMLSENHEIDAWHQQQPATPAPVNAFMLLRKYVHKNNLHATDIVRGKDSDIDRIAEDLDCALQELADVRRERDKLKKEKAEERKKRNEAIDKCNQIEAKCRDLESQLLQLQTTRPRGAPSYDLNWGQAVQNWLNNQPTIHRHLTRTILAEAVQIPEKHQDKYAWVRLRRIMEELGWEKNENVLVNGVRGRGYVRRFYS